MFLAIVVNAIASILGVSAVSGNERINLIVASAGQLWSPPGVIVNLGIAVICPVNVAIVTNGFLIPAFGGAAFLEAAAFVIDDNFPSRRRRCS